MIDPPRQTHKQMAMARWAMATLVFLGYRTFQVAEMAGVNIKTVANACRQHKVRIGERRRGPSMCRYAGQVQKLQPETISALAEKAKKILDKSLAARQPRM